MVAVDHLRHPRTHLIIRACSRTTHAHTASRTHSEFPPAHPPMHAVTHPSTQHKPRPQLYFAAVPTIYFRSSLQVKPADQLIHHHRHHYQQAHPIPTPTHTTPLPYPRAPPHCLLSLHSSAPSTHPLIGPTTNPPIHSSTHPSTYQPIHKPSTRPPLTPPPLPRPSPPAPHPLGFPTLLHLLPLPHLPADTHPSPSQQPKPIANAEANAIAAATAMYLYTPSPSPNYPRNHPHPSSRESFHLSSRPAPRLLYASYVFSPFVPTHRHAHDPIPITHTSFLRCRPILLLVLLFSLPHTHASP